MVHDRAKVESEILPRYFNHASFASLRRQLNYFAFTRVGKGKQKGATYSNDKVIELMDILSLKRRVVGSTPSPSVPVIPEMKIKGGPKKGCKNDCAETKRSSGSVSPSSHAISVDSKSRSNKKSSKETGKKKKTSRKAKEIIDSVVPVVHLPKRAKVESATFWNSLESKKSRPNVDDFTVSVSPPPTDNPMNFASPSELEITLDLTKPPTRSSSNFDQCSFTSFTKLSQGAEKRANTKEADVLAGCSALLALGCQSSS